ncbi:MATE family efflux transporter [Clostridiales Family XIII bacterium BX16]|uniref:Probable multidrug resistance protein NorM n=1 Tax=Lentihominibacter faecis TaxID=2764712 RepID=A0A923NEM2_9FIRM|nr:MATE family efflux transporter [Lentihominibacter faecis]MBC5999237.1 MATE family efflux transporter [Lentihominibacter faecis]
MGELNKMETKPMLPLIVTMSVPPLISMFLQYTYNFVDCMFVSWISEDALTAVSLAFPITTLMIAMSIGTGVGVNVLIARYLGQKNQDMANSVVSNGIILSAACGVIVTIVVLLIMKPFFASFTEDPTIYDMAVDYMRICAFMEVSSMVHICIQKVLQGTGNMIAPMWFQIAGVLLNFVLDPLLIFGVWIFPEMGVEGAAVSTVCGYTFSMILAFYVLIFRKQKVKIKTKGFKLDFKIFKEIFVIGFPSFLMNALGAFMTYFTNLFLVLYSTTAVAFFGAYFKLQQVVIMTLNGLVQGCIPIMSYNYGAKNEKRLTQTFQYGNTIGILLTGVSIIILCLFPSQVLTVFNASEEMLSFGVPALRIMCISYVFAAIATMVASFMQSTKRVKFSLLINILRQFGLLIPAMWLLSKFMGMTGIWYAFIVAEVITAAISWALYKKYPISFDEAA